MVFHAFAAHISGLISSILRVRKSRTKDQHHRNIDAEFVSRDNVHHIGEILHHNEVVVLFHGIMIIVICIAPFPHEAHNGI